MYVGSCKQRYETNLVPSQSNKATIRICFQSSTSLSDLCLTPFCSPLYPHLDSDLSDLPCSAAAAVLPQRALASKQLARELWPVHRKKNPLWPHLGSMDYGMAGEGAGVQTYERLAFFEWRVTQGAARRGARGGLTRVISRSSPRKGGCWRGRQSGWSPL